MTAKYYLKRRFNINFHRGQRFIVSEMKGATNNRSRQVRNSPAKKDSRNCEKLEAPIVVILLTNATAADIGAYSILSTHITPMMKTSTRKYITLNPKIQ